VDVKLAGMTGVALHPPPGRRFTPTRQLVADVVCALALSLEKLGYSVPAAEILARHVADSGLLVLPQCALLITRCFVRAKQGRRAVELAARRMVTDGSSDALQILLSGGAFDLSSLNADDRRLCAVAMTEAAQAVAQDGDTRSAATLLYNSGRILLHSRSARAALRAYRRAADLYPDYANRAYFWQELGGRLFNDGRFSWAARFYERAYALEGTDQTGCLFADACLFAGRYAQAADLFSKHAGTTPDHAEWRLKRFATAALVAMTGAQLQRRQVERAVVVMATSFSEPNTCWQAVEADALCAHAWYNLGVAAVNAARNDEALQMFLLSALAAPFDVESWCNVAILSIQLGDAALFQDAIFVGHFYAAERFLSELHERVLSKVDRTEDATLVTSIADAIADAQRGPEVHLRFHLEGGGFEEVVVGGSSE
jgi:tetratricopeptide (TPR) repeat protein